MVIFKFSKTGNARFYSHLDMIRLFKLALVRAEIPVKLNKKGDMKIYFSPATSIGANSTAEFVEIDCDLLAHKLASDVETYLPDGIKITAEYDSKTRLGIPAIASMAKYEILIDRVDSLQKKITDLLSSDTIKVKLKINNNTSEVLIKDFVNKFYFDKGVLFILAKTAQENLNIPQTIFQMLSLINERDAEFSVTKTNQFAFIDGRYHDIELMAIRKNNI